MAEKGFEQNLLRMIAGTLHTLTCFVAAREMFGKSYFALGVPERVAVDNAVTGFAAANYQAITPQFLASQQGQGAAGFLDQSAKQSKET